LGKYEIASVLGKGAMGIVYKGYEPTIDRTVAIKTLHRSLVEEDETGDALARFQREAQSAGRLNHPGIVTIYDFGEEDGTVYLVMEYIEGRTLRDAFEAEERMAIERIADVMKQMLEALGYAHQNGIVHRDIKPANIMLLDGDRPRVKITDFGIARIDSSNLTQVGTAIGTPGYMSPEQLTGNVVDHRSDLFSAGVVFYQLLTGEKPFSGSVAAIMHKVLKESPLDPSDLNLQCTPALDAVAHKALAKRPEGRFQSAREFIAAIALALTGDAAVADDDATVVVGGVADEEGTRVLPRADAAPADAMPATAAEAAGMSSGAKIAAALAAVAVIGGGSFVMLSGPDRPAEPGPAPTATTSPAQPATPPAAAPAPRTAAAPASDLGTVSIITSPPGASILSQEGALLGVSPMDLKLPEGEYELILSKEGYHDVSASIEVAAGDEVPFEVELTAK
jgi:serine/threonine-protein kinase